MLSLPVRYQIDMIITKTTQKNHNQMQKYEKTDPISRIRSDFRIAKVAIRSCS